MCVGVGVCVAGLLTEVKVFVNTTLVIFVRLEHDVYAVVYSQNVPQCFFVEYKLHKLHKLHVYAADYFPLKCFNQMVVFFLLLKTL